MDLDTSKFILPSQVGGIERYQMDDGPARGVQALCVNTGGGLRYRILGGRGLDIDQAFFNQHSLAFLTHAGVNPATRALDGGLDWLRSFFGGLLTSCGPFNTGAPVADGGENLGLHGSHSNTAATIETVQQPDPHRGVSDMSVVGSVKYGSFYGPCVSLRRTILSPLRTNLIDITDEFCNVGNQTVPHAWLLHINFGYPLIDAGSELCFDAERVDPIDDPSSQRHFRKGKNFRRISGPMSSHRGSSSFVAYLYPRTGRDGKITVGVVNRKLSLGVAIHYRKADFPRCALWQHWGPGEYVCALEPANGGVEGRDKDRARGWLDQLPAGGAKTYRYQIEVLTGKTELHALLKLNR
jgi:hypothetical protein